MIFTHNPEFQKLDFEAQRINEALELTLIDTATYYERNNSFEYSDVSLLELAYILFRAGKETNESMLYTIHNRLHKKCIKNSRTNTDNNIIGPPHLLTYTKNEIMSPSYFLATPAMEYWVSQETAGILVDWYKENHGPKPEQNITKDAPALSKALTDKKQNPEKKSINESYNLKSDHTVTDRLPSQTCKSGSQTIQLELEAIMRNNPPAPVNVTTLFNALLERATNPDSLLTKVDTRKEQFKEKSTSTVWDLDKARYQIKTFMNKTGLNNKTTDS